MRPSFSFLPHLHSLIVFFFILYLTPATAQKGINLKEINLKEGKMKIYLPDDIRSGETISGTVVLEPEGSTEKIKNRNKAALQKYALSYTEANGSVKSLSTHFTILINQNNATIHVNDGNKLISNYSIPVQKEDYKISSFVFPSHVLTQSPFRIHGPFDGNTSNTQCRINGTEIEILAESPRQCIMLMPVAESKPHVVSIIENGKEIQKSIYAVNMNVSAGRLELQKGEKTYVDVLVSGIQNLPASANLTVTNMTTGVVAMQGGEHQSINISPDNHPNNTYNKRFDIQSIKTGSFSVTVNLDLPEPEKITTGSASLCNCYLLEQSCLIPLQMCMELGGSTQPPTFVPDAFIESSSSKQEPIVNLKLPGVFNTKTSLQIPLQLQSSSDDIAAVVFSIKPFSSNNWQAIEKANQNGNNWTANWTPPLGFDGEYIIRASVAGKNNNISETYTRTNLHLTPEASKPLSVEKIFLSVTDAQVNQANQDVRQKEESLRGLKERIAELRRKLEMLMNEWERKNTMAEELTTIDKVIDKIPGLFSDSLKKLTDSLSKLKADLNGKPDNEALKKAAEDAAQREKDCADRLNKLKQEKEAAQKELDDLNKEIDDLLNQMDQLHLGNNWVGGHGYHADGGFWFGYVGDENSNTNIWGEANKLSNKLRGLRKPQNAAKKRVKDLNAEIAKAQEECDKLQKEKEKAAEAEKKGSMHDALETQIDELCRQIAALMDALQKWCKEHPGVCNFNPVPSGSPKTPLEALAYIDQLNDIIKKKKQKETDLKNEAEATAASAAATKAQLDAANAEKNKQEEALKKAQAAADKLQADREKQLEEERAKKRKQQEEEEAKRNTPTPQPRLTKPINPQDKQLKLFALGMLRGLFRDMQIEKGPCDCETKAIALANNTNSAPGDVLGGLAIGIAFAPIEALPGLSLGAKLGIGALKALGSAIYGGENFTEELGKNLFNVIGGEIFPKLLGDEFTGNRMNELASGGLDALLEAEGVRLNSWEGETELRDCGKIKGKTTMLFNPNTGWVTMLIKVDNCPLVVIKYKVNADGVPIGKPTVQKVNG